MNYANPEDRMRMKDQEEAEDFIEKLLAGDLKKAAEELGRDEARYLCDTYYMMQDHRIRSSNRKKAMERAEEPVFMVGWLQTHQKKMEDTIKKVLGLYAERFRAGRWMQSIQGIGPIISAGMLAHLDVTKTETAGGFWRYAGLDPKVTWLGRKKAETMVGEMMDKYGSIHQGHLEAIRLMPPVVAATEALTDNIVVLATTRDGRSTTKERLLEHLVDDLHLPLREAKQTIKHAIAEVGEIGPDILDDLAEATGFDVEWFFKNIEPPMTGKKLVALLAKRPWNADLKRLCWNLGESFKFQRNHPNDFYGKIYYTYKQYLIRKNTGGEFSDRSGQILKDKRYNKATVAYGAYSKGILPDGHIHAMARRYAVKIFLSHLFDKMYRWQYGTEPPKPFAIEHLGHVHMIDAPPDVD